MKKLNTLLLAAMLSCSIMGAQEISNPLTVKVELPNIEETFEAPQDKIQTFKENSIGIMFMPIPLQIGDVTDPNGNLFSSDDFNPFTVGVGLTLNLDFNLSGFGFGTLAYVAVISGTDYTNGKLRAYDVFYALKYDIALGDRAETDWEISPLIGLGSLVFQVVNDGDPRTIGNSLYVSGGARITWRAANKLFLGVDIQTVPAPFNKAKLLGADDTDATFDYKFIAQANLSLRYSIF
jgi:hypothetical protein